MTPSRYCPRVSILVFILLTACATPAQRIDQLAFTAGCQRYDLIAAPFQLIAYSHHLPARTRHLHVYLEGDGLPWVTPTRIATDPTPRRPLALQLMLLDLQPSVYLARPCYNATMTSACNAWHWTSGRYSEQVVAAMTTALRQLIMRTGATQVTLIGYSGGGVLAWLLAARVPETTQLITIAANLDVRGWIEWHGFSPLTDSLTPATHPLPASIQQWHFIGNRDTNVPPQLTRRFIATHSPAARVTHIENADHTCCWESVWQRVLRGELGFTPLE